MGQLRAVHLRGQTKPQPRGSSGPRIRCSSLQTLNRSPVVIRLPGFVSSPFCLFQRAAADICTAAARFHDRRPLRTHNYIRAAAPLFLNGNTMSFRAFRRSRPSVSTLSRSGPIARIFLKYFYHKGFSGDTLREVRSLAGLQPLKSQTPSFLGVSCFTCRILIIEK